MIKIVLCDDEVRFLEIEKKLIAEYFEDKGMTFSVESYSSGEELLKDEAMLKTADLIILDVEMKGIDGISAAKKIREQNDKVNIAFLSAHMNYSTDGDQFQAYYKDVSLRMKNKELDLLIRNNIGFYDRKKES